MVNKPKAKGTAAETRVVNYLLAAGVEARRIVLHGSKDEGDIFVEGWKGEHSSRILEVKAGKQTIKVSRAQLDDWIEEAETEGINAGGLIAYLVLAKHNASVKDYQVYKRVVWPARREFMYLDEFARFMGGSPE
jgi:Holliday junction resolvase